MKGVVAIAAGTALALLAARGAAMDGATAGGARGAGFAGAARDGGGRFLNTAGEIGFAGPAVTVPFFFRRMVALGAGRAGAPPAVVNDGAFLRENARHSEPTVTWIGHATLLVQMDHVTFLTDPIWSERASPLSFAGPGRLVPPGVALDALPPIDFVLVSHNHYDHMDVETLRAIARRDPGAVFIVPLANRATLAEAGIARIVELDWGGETEVRGVRIACLPAQHWSARGALDRRAALWASYAVVGAQRRFYFSGDTGYFDGFARIGGSFGPFDLAAVPIGAYLPVEMMRPWHMNPEEAARAAADLRARQVIGMHYGTFDLTDEPPGEPPARFRAAAAAAGFAPEATLLPAVGETRRF